MKANISIAILACLVSPFFSAGQAIKKMDSTDLKSLYNSSYVTAAVNYASDWVFAGRKDSVKCPYVSPSVSYYHKSGLFVKGQFSYLTAASAGRIDMFSFSGGYLFSKSRLYGGVDGSVQLFNDSSYAVSSTMSGRIGVYTGYDFSMAELTLDVNGLFGQGATDVLTGIELSRRFWLFNDRVTIYPSVYVLAGTQNYYSDYYTTRRSGAKGRPGRGSAGESEVTSFVSSTTRRFELLSIDISLPLSYSFGQCKVSFTPVYSFPQNIPDVTTSGTTTSQDFGNLFYWNAGFRYVF
jgi:hypothetical protein